MNSWNSNYPEGVNERGVEEMKALLGYLFYGIGASGFMFGGMYIVYDRPCIASILIIVGVIMMSIYRTIVETEAEKRAKSNE